MRIRSEDICFISLKNGKQGICLGHEKAHLFSLSPVGCIGMWSPVDITPSKLAGSFLCGRLYLLEPGTEQLAGRASSAGAGLALPHPASGLCPINGENGQRIGRPSPSRQLRETTILFQPIYNPLAGIIAKNRAGNG